MSRPATPDEPLQITQLRNVGLALDTEDVTNIAVNPEVWEKVVRKLRVGAMPPPPRPRPDQATYDGFRVWLENEPDAMDAGYTALHAAVLRGDLTTVEALLAHGADPNIRLEKGTPTRRTSEDWMLRSSFVSATPFWLVARFREPAIMRALATGGADPRLTTTEVWEGVVERAGGVGPPRVVGGFVTPVMAAVRGASDRERFFAFGPDPAIEERRALEAVTVAADLGVHIDAVDFNGTAALHTAASRNLKSVVRFLGERGAALDVRNGSGRTPLDLALAASLRPQNRRYPVWSGETAVDVLRQLGVKELFR